MLQFYIVGTVPTAPSPESLVDALRSVGHTAEIVQKSPWCLTAFVLELAVGPSGHRVFVDVSEDLHADWDLIMSEREFLEEFVPEDEQAMARRLIQIRYWQPSDFAIIADLTDFLCRKTCGRVLAIAD